MKNLCRRMVAGISLLACLFMMSSTNASPPAPLPFAQSEPGAIIRTLKIMRSPEYSAAAPAILPLLNHPNANVVRDTCRTLAVIANKDVIHSIEPLLNDQRADVRQDAQKSIDKISANPRPAYDVEQKKSAELAESDPASVIRMLKLLRSPEYSAVVPAILPFLQNRSDNVVRDACRTLAVVANKEVIPNIEPLLKNHSSKVQKDAQDAIDKLRAKP
jgi:HEAT repeat protein